MAHATTIPNITIVSCYDADTCRVNLPRSAFNDDWAYELFGHNIPIRVGGIDTPEKRVQYQQEKDVTTTVLNPPMKEDQSLKRPTIGSKYKF